MATDEAPDRGGGPQLIAVRRGVVLIMMLAVVLGGVLVGVVGFVTIEAFLNRPGSVVDKYDDTIRGTHLIPTRVEFGQTIGPDGDGCWPENGQAIGGTVFCDLVSIGGLHWDTGDVKMADRDIGAYRIGIGSGYMCLLDEVGAPWCWEWSSEVQPRPARAPQDTVLRIIKEAGGSVCGQTPDYVTVICWTVGVDQQSYQQVNHRSRDGSEWHLFDVEDDPPLFNARQKTTGRHERFDAFTGKKWTTGEQWARQVEVPRLLISETTS